MSRPAGHHLPHLHAYYQEHVGICGLDPIELVAGSLPKRQERLVLAWAELDRDELLSSWNTLQGGRPPSKIEPFGSNSMSHEIHRVTDVETVAPFTLRVAFEDSTLDSAT